MTDYVTRRELKAMMNKFVSEINKAVWVEKQLRVSEEYDAFVQEWHDAGKPSMKSITLIDKPNNLKIIYKD